MSKKSRAARTRTRTATRVPSAPAAVLEPEAVVEAPPPPVEAPRAPVDRGAWLLRAGIAVALAGATVLAYRPVLDAGFLNWDDPAYVTGNAEIRTLDWHTVAWAFTTFQEGIWHPLTWLSLALDYRLYGLTPRGFHLTNVLLHAANTVLVFVVWERLTGARWRSAAVAALFGLHPMHVESVAWVTERKDVLSTFFALLTVGTYAEYAARRTAENYAAVVVAYVLGLLSKPMLVTVPFLLLLLDWWPLRRLSWRAAAEKLPLLALAAVVIAISLRAVAGVSAAAVPDPIPPRGMVANAIVSTVAYVKLTLWPAGLSAWYSHPWFEGPPLTAAKVAGAALVLAAVTAATVAGARRFPYAPVGWLWFLVALLPVLGLVYNGRQGMADRYAYIPHVGLFMAIVWGVADLPLWRPRAARLAGAAALAGVLAVLGMRTARQTRIWHDDRAFWADTVRTNRYSFIAHQALAMYVQDEGRTRDAIALYGRAVRIRPDYARVRAQFARLLMRAGRPGAAAAQYRKAVDLEPDSADYQLGLAQALVAQGRPATARQHVEAVLARRADHVAARRLLAELDARRTATSP